MTNTDIRRIIILGAIAIFSIISVQAYWVLRTWDLQEREFNRKVMQALMDAATAMKTHYRFVLPEQNLIERLASNYYVVNLNNVFDAQVLEYHLQKEFERQNMHENFEYGIFDCSSNQMVAGKQIVYTKDKAVEELSNPLPAHTNSDFIYYFGVRFPNKAANILSNMWIVLAFTVLMLVTVAFFIYSMFVILRQKQLSEFQRDFINNMTHEFKTPISTINISTDVFLQNELIKSDPRLNRYAGIIKEQINRLNTQVEKVLQLAKTERGELNMQLETVNLGQLLENILPSLEIKAAERQGQVTLKISGNNSQVTADKIHLTNIIHNLVDNAVKYSKNTPQIDISIENENNGSQVLLKVKDNGIGIAPENVKHIFDKFYRVPTGNVHNVKGFGLGLFYVKSICNEHNWMLKVESALNVGTTFCIRIPVVNNG